MNEQQPADYLRNAYCCARQSKDTSNQNGSTLVNTMGKIIGTGVNNFPVGVQYTEERATTRPTKYRFFEHAERNSVYAAARAGEEVYGATMFCPWAACCDCARSIIQSGVLVLYMHRERMLMTPERWQDDVNEALEMMVEAGVTLQYHEGPIDGCPDLLVNGELWNPADKPLTEGSGNWLVGMEEVS